MFFHARYCGLPNKRMPQPAETLHFTTPSSNLFPYFFISVLAVRLFYFPHIFIRLWPSLTFSKGPAAGLAFLV